MTDGDPKGAATTRWWLSPAVARMAFGDPTQGSRATRPTFPPSAVLEIDLSDPNQRAFGDYELIDIAGRGGMGVVYRARQRELDREVALKLLSAGNWASAEFIDSFRREAQNAARLQHPNIVVVHEMGEYGGLIYYAMQLVRGRSLSQRIDQGGPMPPREAARLLRAVAEAVDYAHRLGVLHLDLKPGNILINEDGEPLVADFGLARRLEQVADTDIIAGTPGYMAPEQARMDGPALSPATDVWALGAVLYEMLTGHPPFEAEDPAEVLRLLLEARVRKPSRYLPVPADLEAICLKCLRQHPSARYMSTRALADDLGRFLEGREVSVRPLGPLQRAWHWMQREPHFAAAAALATVLLVAGVITTSLQWRRAENESALARHNLWEQRREAAYQQQDGGGGFGALPLLVENLREAEAHGARGDAAMDRLRIGLLLDSSPRLIDVIALGKWITSVGISGDGRLVAAGCMGGDIRLFETATGRERWRLATADFPKLLDDVDDIDRLVFSPDGRYLVAMAQWPTPVINPSGQSMMLIEVASGRLLRPPAGFARFQDATFSADGRIALLRGNDDSARVFRTSDWTPLGPLVRRGFKAGAWLMSTDGARLAYWVPAGVELLDARTLAVRHRSRNASAWAFSPDGRWLALGDQGGNVWLVNADTGAERHLSPPPAARVRWLSFSADGSWLVSSSATAGPGNVHGWSLKDDSALMPPVPLRLAASVEVDQRRGLLSVRDNNRLRLYQIVSPGSPVLPLGPALDSPGLMFGYAADADFERGLVATGGAEGELRLWRLHDSGRLLEGRTPPAPGNGHFDGRHLPFVDGTRAGVIEVDVDNGRRATATLQHPQPVYFAELDANADSLITVAGREIRLWNWRTGQLRHAPWRLPETPQRIALSPSGNRLALTYARPRDARASEILRILDLVRGAWLPTRPTLTGPLIGLRFSPDGSGLAAWSNYPARLYLIDAGSTTPPRRPALPDTAAEVRDTAFSRDGKSLYAAMAANREQSRGNVLLRWDVRTSRLLAQTAVVGEPMTVTISGDGTRLAIGGPARTLLDIDGGKIVRVPRPPDNAAFDAVALSHDGSIAAYAARSSVHLADARTGKPLAPPLQMALAEPDRITSLAIAPDRHSVAARTAFGRWLLWPLPVEQRPLAAIATETELLSGGARDYGAPMSPPLPSATRDALRGGDPGSGAIQAPMLARTGAPPDRGEAVPVDLLDLSRFYTGPLVDPEMTATGDGPELFQVPVGRQRFLGIDYDVRGVIRLSDASLGSPGPTRLGNVPVDRYATALHVLATSEGRSQTRRPVALARIVLNYADGSHASLPIVWGREFAAFWDDPNEFRQPQLAWFHAPDYGWGSDATSLFAMRLPNPHPARRIASIDLETTSERWSAAAFVAITLEPPAASATTAGAQASQPAPELNALR